MKVIKIFERAGVFSENKDVAQEIRLKEIIPAFESQEEVVLDFEGVDAATQSFIHALISDVMRKYGIDSLDRLAFKSCNETVKAIINIVVDYMQEGMGIKTSED
ncbi:MAG: STAS-like domain-containing protein [Deltaproteobacteria bacterium]|nr:MAG: STAS-like domain-containing protein [Deltaproteobacteria bacterium]